ncbi:hypothetical protein GGX14DRAFT_662970 [Mycena pura]|uniref:Uncharacterized protein n=1 Tax=Mycena pura TaxID=153505 RepID=A0AAD6VTE6_9AGAR|nr:hypothetical protein GGX14DRAFT_662970 [Mycena pura]
MASSWESQLELICRTVGGVLLTHHNYPFFSTPFQMSGLLDVFKLEKTELVLITPNASRGGAIACSHASFFSSYHVHSDCIPAPLWTRRRELPPSRRAALGDAAGTLSNLKGLLLPAARTSVPRGRGVLRGSETVRRAGMIMRTRQVAARVVLRWCGACSDRCDKVDSLPHFAPGARLSEALFLCHALAALQAVLAALLDWPTLRPQVPRWKRWWCVHGKARPGPAGQRTGKSGARSRYAVAVDPYAKVMEGPKLRPAATTRSRAQSVKDACEDEEGGAEAPTE